MKTSGMYCVRCAKSGIQRKMLVGADMKRDGMSVKCEGCGFSDNYEHYMSLKPPMEKIIFQEKQPAGTVRMETWIVPEVMEALKQRFPQNLLTTLSSLYTSIADQDTVLVEGDCARDLASLGIKRGREVVALAKEVKQLRERNKELEMQQKILQPFMKAIMGQQGQAMEPPQADFSVPEVDFSPTGEAGDVTEPRPAFITSFGR